MPVRIKDYVKFEGTLSPGSLGTEYTVLEITGEDEPYMVEGYIDLSALQSGDSVRIREYISVDGANYRIYEEGDFNGPVDKPVLRFHTKTLLGSMKYKVTLTQTAGTLRSFPYKFIEERLETV